LTWLKYCSSSLDNKNPCGIESSTLSLCQLGFWTSVTFVVTTSKWFCATSKLLAYGPQRLEFGMNTLTLSRINRFGWLLQQLAGRNKYIQWKYFSHE
jgi:hypothetical protein